MLTNVKCPACDKFISFVIRTEHVNEYGPDDIGEKMECGGVDEGCCNAALDETDPEKKALIQQAFDQAAEYAKPKFKEAMNIQLDIDQILGFDVATHDHKNIKWMVKKLNELLATEVNMQDLRPVSEYTTDEVLLIRKKG